MDDHMYPSSPQKQGSLYRKVRTSVQKNVLNILVLIIALAASAAATAFSYSYANDSISKLSLELRQEVLADVSSQIAGFIAKSNAMIPVMQEYVARRYVDSGNITNPDLLKSANQLALFWKASDVYSLFYMDTLHHNVGFGGVRAAPLGLIIWPGTLATGINIYLANSNVSITNISNPTFVLPPPDPSAFAAVEILQKTGQPLWSPVFTLDSGSSLQVIFSYSVPVNYADNGEYAGLVGSNISIEELSTLLSQITFITTGKIFLTDTTGILIADQVFSLREYVDKSGQLPIAANNTDRVIAETAKNVLKTYGSFSNIPSTIQLLTYNIDGNNQLIQIGSYIQDNLHLLIFIVVSEDEFIGQINFSRKITISLTVVAAVLGAIRYLPLDTMYKWIRNKVRGTTTTKVEPISFQAS